MQRSDVLIAANRLGCPIAHVQAVLAVESAGCGFDSAGRPKMLFEPHILWRELAGDQGKLDMAVKAGLAYQRQGTQPYPPTSEANYARVKRACLLDQGAALRSASWGIAQVMGFNYSVGAYASEQEMVQACMDSEAAQFGLLVGYVERNGLAKYLRDGNWLAFARGYNGIGAAPAYAARIVAAVLRIQALPSAANIVAPVLSPQPVPPVVSVAAETVAADSLGDDSSTDGAPQPTADALMDAEWLQIRAGQIAQA